MDKNEIAEKLIDAIAKGQEASGRPPGAINCASKPIDDISGFDSLTGVEAVVLLFKSLGCKPPVKNLFYSKEENRALTIEEISDNIYRFCLETKEVLPQLKWDD